jgi:hypothetical protein
MLTHWKKGRNAAISVKSSQTGNRPPSGAGGNLTVASALIHVHISGNPAAPSPTFSVGGTPEQG